ncbi:MAG: hypothetical protein PHW02_08670 [bacterium]|nr:hypothetical protein [bacterium]
MVKKNFIPILILIALIVSLSDCSLLFWRSDPNDISEWYTEQPEGTILKYDYKFYFRDTLDECLISTDTITLKMGNTVEKDSFRLTEIEKSDGWGGGENDIYQIIDEKNGIILTSYDTIYDCEDDISLKTPVEVGTTWDNYYERKYAITSINASLSLQSGDFNDLIVIERGNKGEVPYEIIYLSKSLNTYVYREMVSTVVPGDTIYKFYELISKE